MHNQEINTGKKCNACMKSQVISSISLMGGWLVSCNVTNSCPLEPLTGLLSASNGTKDIKSDETGTIRVRLIKVVRL